MERRRLIGCIINCPDNIYQNHVLDGLMSRCDRYGYNLAVFSPLANTTHFYKDYLRGEFNLLQLINFDMLDAVVVVSLPLVAMGDFTWFDYTRDILKQRCKKPVVCLDLPMDDYSAVYTDDTTPFRMITRHVLEAHKCRKVYFLAGSQTEGVEDKRIKGFREECESHCLKADESRVFYGDFWYNSGYELADRITSGELEMPDAVICASDHMALGVANKLIEKGIPVPEKVIVTGYDATQEAMVNELSITTYSPNVAGMAEEAIDKIRAIIEPKAEIAVSDYNAESDIVIGHSCGCSIDYTHLLRSLKSALYKPNRDFNNAQVQDNEDMYRLNESYMLEALTECKNPIECLGQISAQTYLMRPFDTFYLCLRRNWLGDEQSMTAGFPSSMRTNIVAVSGDNNDGREYYHCDDDRGTFTTRLMLPQLFERYEVPQVFYFYPVHFQEDTLGYSVMQHKCSSGMKPTYVVRNWIRNINIALQMTRVNNRLVDVSELDKLTGLKNRRGMENALKEIAARTEKGKANCYAIVIDMDGLKHINDNYGHTEGDYAIAAIASAVSKVEEDDCEVAVRAGGDEFYLVGISDHITEKTLVAKVSRYRSIIDDLNRHSGKPYDISASVGFCLRQYNGDSDMEAAINSADKHMYLCKSESKKNRE